MLLIAKQLQMNHVILGPQFVSKSWEVKSFVSLIEMLVILWNKNWIVSFMPVLQYFNDLFILSVVYVNDHACKTRWLECHPLRGNACII